VVDRVTAAHEKLEFGETGRAFYDFFWSQFADWYIESAKPRLYGSDVTAAQTTRAVSPRSARFACQSMHDPFSSAHTICTI
jgi:valyl-tRNA synthetase